MGSGEAKAELMVRMLRQGKGYGCSMIPSNLRITLIAAVICYFVLILYFLKHRALYVNTCNISGTVNLYYPHPWN